MILIYLFLNSYKWFIPYTHSVETVNSTNSEIFSLTPNNLWEKVIWFTPEESSSINYNFYIKEIV
jgi:hypothetical protein